MAQQNEILLKEIDLIQSCINRMAQNSFVVKGWTITLVAVVLALLPERVDMQMLSIIGVLATLCFWYLDAFFLKMELLYRWKYEWVIENRTNSDKFYYDLNPYNEKMWLLDNDKKSRKEPCVFQIMFTKTLIPIYIPMVLISISFFIKSLH
ncbi:hypothetical protein [Candidatus Agathobaculum pullicola]|uniref:hypothetical protein n=1 Tax=Candidatus Agathobaculum pullicola TaxID=2838426 RepID=UPI003F8F5412